MPAAVIGGWVLSAEVGPHKIVDRLLWGSAFALVGVGIAGNYYYAEQPLLYRVMILAALALAGLFLVARTQAGANFLVLLSEARTEIRKVIWPTHQETVRTTLLVVVLVIIAALVLWGLDSLLSWAALLLIG